MIDYKGQMHTNLPKSAMKREKTRLTAAMAQAIRLKWETP